MNKIKRGCFLRESKYDSPNHHGARGGLPGLEFYDVHGENLERMLVQGLEQPTHPKNPIPDHRHYYHAPPQRSYCA
jgi:hypothetical protein